MIASEFDGQQVTYIDPLKLQHSGVIVGQSKDEAWFYVHSDNPNADPDQAWHFKVAAQQLPALLQPATQQ